MTIIKDTLAILLIIGILFTNVNNWFVLIGILILAGNYSVKGK